MKRIAKSFQDLEVVFTNGQMQVTVKGSEPSETVASDDELASLNADIERMRSFIQTSSGDWLDGDDMNQMGIISRTVYLEESFIENELQNVLTGMGLETQWLANQGLMMSNTPMFGMHRSMLVLLARSLNSSGEVEWDYPLMSAEEAERRPLHSFKRAYIDDIWVYTGPEDEDTGEWMVHPELLKAVRYDDLTDEEEYRVIQYIQQRVQEQGFRVMSGFTAFYGKYRYCMLLPEVGETIAVPGQVDDNGQRQSSLKDVSRWANSNKICIRYPRFLERKVPDRRNRPESRYMGGL